MSCIQIWHERHSPKRPKSEIERKSRPFFCMLCPPTHENSQNYFCSISLSLSRTIDRGADSNWIRCNDAVWFISHPIIIVTFGVITWQSYARNLVQRRQSEADLLVSFRFMNAFFSVVAHRDVIIVCHQESFMTVMPHNKSSFLSFTQTFSSSQSFFYCTLIRTTIRKMFFWESIICHHFSRGKFYSFPAPLTHSQELVIIVRTLLYANFNGFHLPFDMMRSGEEIKANKCNYEAEGFLWAIHMFEKLIVVLNWIIIEF